MPVSLLIPGVPDSLEGWSRALARHGLRIAGTKLEGAEHVSWVELIANDGHFSDAFGFGTVDASLRASISTAGSALLLAVPPPLQDVAAPMADVVEALGRAGAMAVHVSESKLSLPLSEWVELVRSGNPWSLYRAIVAVTTEGDALESYGMHVFARPDARLVATGIEGHRLLGAFNVFQIAEDPLLRSGETFSPDAAAARRPLDRRPDTRYPEDTPWHNPFGVWELGPEGGPPRRRADVELVFIPSLMALLHSEEDRKGAPLTEREVLAIRDKASCMAMDPRAAQTMERSRGYADIDPERAFEHWQMLRLARQ